MPQNQRSSTRTVSPGLSGVAVGTLMRTVPRASVWVTMTRSRLARGEKPPAMATALSTVMFGTNGYWPGAATSPRMKNGRLDLGGDVRLADVTVAQPRGDGGGQFSRRAAARGDGADQWHGDAAAGTDQIGVGEALLAVDHDAQPVAGIEPVGGIVHNRRRRRRHPSSIGQRIESVVRTDHRRRLPHASRQRQRSAGTE